jgi:xylulokinase
VPALGLDIGTQSAKAVILGDGLEILGMGSSGYQPNLPQPGRAEQDPQLWLEALRPAIGAALASAGLEPRDVGSLAVCGQLDGCVPADAAGRALAPAIIWMDRRAAALIEAVDADLVHARSGLVRDATHMAGKIAWLGRNLERRSEVAAWHQPVSFVVEALTGRRVMSRSLASTTMLYGLVGGDWDGELMALFGVKPGELPELADAADVAGPLSGAGAELTGLPAGLPVAVGTGDDFSNPLGCGICRPGIVGVSLGTAETVGALSRSPLIDGARLVETHAYPGGLYHLGNPGWLSGGAVRWAAGMLSVDGDAAFSALAAEAPPGCEGLVFIPALNGAMAPKWIAEARGSFTGLTHRHGRAHLARAVLEGTAFAMRDVVDRLAALGVPADRLRLMGGGARSRLWCEIRAGVSGRPVEVLAEADASAVGSALLALVAAGRMPDVATASGALRLRMDEIPPVLVEPYDEAYRSYRAAFAALEPLWLEKDLIR